MSKQTTITENTVFYRTFPEQNGSYGDYVIRHLAVYSIRPYALEHAENGIYDLEHFLTLKYQKNGQNDEHASEQMKTRFYGERIDEFNVYPNSEVFLKASKLFAKMEKAYKELDKDGLTVQNSDDAFLFRLAMLKMIGAKKVEYDSNQHGFYVVD